MKIKHFNLQIGSQIFKALSDESRLRILHLLYQNDEMCISDLEMILNFTQTKVSRHISYLKNSDLIKSRKCDQWTFYQVKDEIEGLTEVVFSYLGKAPELIKDLETYHILYSNRELAINKLERKERRASFISY